MLCPLFLALSLSLSLSNLSCCSVLRISALNRTARCQFHFSNFLSYWYVSYLIFVCSTFSTQSSEWCLKLKNRTHSSYIGLIVSNEHVIDVKECQSWSTFNDIGLDLGCWHWLGLRAIWGLLDFALVKSEVLTEHIWMLFSAKCRACSCPSACD